MYIKKLILSETFPEEKEIRNITFKKGLNVIVDDSGKRGNNVGKTTALKVIDICLGAKDKKYIYTDFETGSINSKLKNYIEDKKVIAELILTNTFSEKNAWELNLRVELYNRGKRYINGKNRTQKEVHLDLNRIIFDNNDKNPTFRQLIPKFVRIDQKGDNDKFLKYLHSSTSDIDYKNIYSYLFRLINEETNKRILELEKNIADCKNDMRKFKQMHRFNNVSELLQSLEILKGNIIQIEGKLFRIINSDEYRLTEKEIGEIKVYYTKLIDRLDRLNFESEHIKNILYSAKQEAPTVDTALLHNLYDETSKVFKNLNKDFKDLLEFNQQLVENKIRFYENQLVKKNKEIEITSQEIDRIFLENKDVIMLIRENSVEEYNKLQKDLLKYQEEKGRISEVYEVYKGIEDKLKENTEKLEDININDKTIEQKIKKFNVYFTDYSKKISNDNYFLYYNKEGFPISIGNVDGGLSTGTKKSIISSFDLSYLKFAQEIGISIPYFIIHDVLESMDGDSFENMTRIVNSMDCQYIVAVLYEKISHYEMIKHEDIRVRLSKEDKLFRM